MPVTGGLVRICPAALSRAAAAISGSLTMSCLVSVGDVWLAREVFSPRADLNESTDSSGSKSEHCWVTTLSQTECAGSLSARVFSSS